MQITMFMVDTERKVQDLKLIQEILAVFSGKNYINLEFYTKINFVFHMYPPPLMKF